MAEELAGKADEVTAAAAKGREQVEDAIRDQPCGAVACRGGRLPAGHAGAPMSAPSQDGSSLLTALAKSLALSAPSPPARPPGGRVR